MEVHEVLIALAFLSLLVEITVYPIPAESSCFQLLFKADEGGEGARQEDHLTHARKQGAATKVLFYLLPTALGVILFLIPLIAIAWSGILDYTVRLSALEGPPLLWIGMGLVVVGRTLTFGSVLQLRRTKRVSGHEAHISGIFQYSRNPGLVGMFTFYLGLACIYPSILLFAGFVPYFFNMHKRVLMEESWLARSGGESFRRYLSTVPRYFIF